MINYFKIYAELISDAIGVSILRCFNLLTFPLFIHKRRQKKDGNRMQQSRI